jgi:tetratricopeptide (TPR) repeat protein
MVGMIQLVLNAVRGPWRLGFFAAVVVAVILALLAPAIGWSDGVRPGIAFVVIVASGFVAGGLPIFLGRDLILKGRALTEAGKYDEAVDLFDSYPRRFGEDHLHGGRVALALELKGDALSKSGRPSQALTAFEDMLTQYPDIRDARAEVRTARVLVRKASALRTLERPIEAAAIYDQVILQFARSRYSSVRKSVAAAQVERDELSGVARTEQAPGNAATAS